VNEPKKTTSIAARVSAEKIAEIEGIVGEYGLSKVSTLGQIGMTLAMAEGLQRLAIALSPEVMAPIMALQGSKLGFLSDKDREGGYGQEIVKRCVTEALLRGVRPVLNEMNIIAGGFYATREAFVRLLKEFPGLTELRIDLGVPRNAGDKGAVVACKASWKLCGSSDSMEADIPIKVNGGMGADAILGKAERKMRARIYNRLSGSEFPEGEVGDVLVEKPAGSGATEGVRKVGTPTAKPKPETVTVQRSPAELTELDALAEDAGIPPMAVNEASQKMFGRPPSELSDAEFGTLKGWVKNGDGDAA
jgi:hypothetical protein